MLTGIALTLGVLVLVVIMLGLACRLWLGSTGFIAERVRVELEQRAAERQIHQIAHAAMQRLLDEARRHQ